MLASISLRTKMIGGFVLIALVSGVVGMVSLRAMEKMTQADQRLYQDATVPLPNLSDIGVTFQRMRVASRDFINAQGDAAQRAKFQGQLNDLGLEMTRASDALERRNLSPQMRSEFERYKEARKAYEAYLAQIVALAEAGKDKEAWGILWSEGYNSNAAAELNSINRMEEMKVGEARQSSDENTALASTSTMQMTVTIIIGLLLAIAIGLWLTSLVSRGVAKVVRALEKVAAGDLSVRIDVETTDELGRIGLAINRTLENVGAVVGGIGQNSQSLATSAEELSAVSHQMSTNAEETSSQASVVSAAAEQTTRNLQTVATATEEMTASIREIAKNSVEAARIATTAMKAAVNTNSTVSKLGESSGEIGQVVKVITSIAQQTNLLALNATIEAARAGEAGKGFAVVANEVKELAKETARATEVISQKIDLIQGNTGQAIEMIREISGIITQVNDISNTIASAVEEQTATTNEIARNVAEAARGSSQVTENITAVAQAAKSTATGASHTQTAAGDLSKMASEIQRLVTGLNHNGTRTGSGKVTFVEQRA